ncbi:hypothetical protein P170DRAFT_425463 [Aspergillus steynii IBT 23096]|uniref:Uncharacterized protein n=1 Tax=Aspergillus steynii IBT 23096 TaxID=1392250 RepID=A0A2I2GE91_9EURO|nr:uncharacterized protein P170DRAFT_425463 [Aspergillus steynii IBT 23096]PLB51205.1 hypothetical protein P170DRAFT_425463 [Aspergillus steynii IBT 23096]
MSQTGQSEPDDDEPWRPRRKRQSSETRPSVPAELVPGVNVDDLPIAEPFTTDAIKRYQVMPVARKLDWRTPFHGKPRRRSLANKISRTAAFIQTTGVEVADPCSNCDKGLGPWQACVIMINEEDSKLAGTCANCQFSRKYDCDFRAFKIEDIYDFNSENAWKSIPDKKDEMSGQSRVDRTVTTVLSAELPDWFSNNRSLFSGAQPIAISKSQSPETSNTTTSYPGILPARPAQRESLVETQVSVEAIVVKEEKDSILSASLAQRERLVESQVSVEGAIVKEERDATNLTLNPNLDVTKSKLDGGLLPFPLGPDAFDNLPLLRQAIKDTEKHLQAMRKRADELEVKEKQKSWRLPDQPPSTS